MRLITDNSAWHYDDKAWLKERKQEWNHITPVLKQMERIEGSYLKVHKELFFKGEINDPKLNVEAGGIVMGYAYPLFWMWYHPEPSFQLFDAIMHHIYTLKDQLSVLRTSRDIFLKSSHKIESNMSREYGMFGGREKLLTDVFIRSNFRTERWETQHSYYELGLPVSSICGKVISTREILSGNSNYSPYMPGRYLVNRLDQVIEEACEDEFNLHHFRLLIEQCLTFNAREGNHLVDKYAIEYQKELMNPYEERTYTSAMLALWDEVAKELAENDQ